MEEEKKLDFLLACRKKMRKKFFDFFGGENDNIS